MRGVVLDAWAVLALLRGERPAGDVVRRYVRRTADGRFEVLLNVVNLGEVLYRLIQIEGRAEAAERFARFRRVRSPLSRPENRSFSKPPS